VKATSSRRDHQQDQGEASYCGLCRAKKVRDFVDNKIFKIKIFKSADILLMPRFSKSLDILLKQRFKSAVILLTPGFLKTLYI
jgi:hypothetical protein